MEGNGSAPEPDEWKEVSDSAKTFTRWALAGLIDGAFLIVWVATQWATGQIIDRLPLEGIDAMQRDIFQWLFAVATIVPIVLYIYKDFRIMWIRIKRSIRKEQERDSNKGENPSGN